uniref:Spindle and kinetochore-associated protein 3 n=1 Tax=Strongyloides papillosus TaxID=174720 RepID=A0A0N5CC06_STREA
MTKEASDGIFKKEINWCNKLNRSIINCKVIVGNILYEIVTMRDNIDKCLESFTKLTEILKKMESLNSERLKVMESFMEACSSGDSENVGTDPNPPPKGTEVKIEGYRDIEKQLTPVSSKLSSLSFSESAVGSSKMPLTIVDETSEKSISPDYNLDDSKSEWSEDIYHQCGDVKLYIHHKGSNKIRLGKVTYTFKEYQEKKLLQVKCSQLKDIRDIFFDCVTDSENFHLYYRNDYAIIKIKPSAVTGCSPVIKSYVLKFDSKAEGSSVYHHILRKPFSMH